MVEEDWDSVRVVESPDLLWGRLRSGWDPWNILNRIRYLKGNHEFDIVHAFETRPATIYPILYLLKSKPLPLVIDWIDWWGRGGLMLVNRPFWYQKILGRFETYFEEHFRPLAHSTTVISQALGKRAEGLGVDPGTISWIPDGADIDLFIPRDRSRYRSQFGIEQDKFVLGYSALDVIDDAELVLHALKHLLLTHPETVLITTGKVSRRLQQLALDLGIAKEFRQLGFLPASQLPLALSCADVFLLPFRDKISNIGRWPHKLGDYMALARPTVTNPVGEMRTLFTEEKIGLLADETPVDFAQKIFQLIQDEELRLELGRNARRIAETKFAWPHIVDRLEQCYGETLERSVQS